MTSSSNSDGATSNVPSPHIAPPISRTAFASALTSALFEQHLDLLHPPRDEVALE